MHTPERGTTPAKLDLASELDRHRSWLRTVIFARVGCRDAVDDVIQEVSLAAIENRSPMRDATRISAWLYRTAITLAVLHRRKLGRMRRRQTAWARRTQGQSANSASASPLTHILKREREQEIQANLARLTSGERELLMLKYIENWSYQEIADHLGLSHSSVESRLHRARQRMRTMMSELDSVHTG